MDYKSINLKKADKQEMLKNILDGQFVIPSAKEKNEIQKTIQSSVETGNYIVARNALILGIYFDSSRTFLNIRKKGIFRYSNYVNKKCIVGSLTSELIDICNLVKYNSTNDLDYLLSVSNISNIHSSYNEINQLIISELKSFKSKYKGRSFVKTILSYVDFLFLTNHYPKSVDDPMEISSRSKEEISSAVSYLIYYISSIDEKNVEDTSLVSEDYIKSGEIGRIIIAACFISDFKEFEILIDHFNYKCILKGGILKILPPSEDFEKSIRLGFIRTQLQSFNDRVIEKEAESLENIFWEISKSEKLEFFKYTESHNYPRYRVEVPEPVYEFILEHFFKPDSFFHEEIDYLSHIFKEQLLNLDDLSKIKIKDDLTLLEFIKIKRVFYLFYFLFTNQIYKKEKVDTELLLRSLIPVIPEESFYKFLEKLTTPENIDSFLDVSCWEPNLDIFFDLQYHPILFLNKHFVIPLTILIHSNSIRNLFASEYKQNNTSILTDGFIDPIVDKLHSSFNKANIVSYKQTSVFNSDIDLFAVLGNTLFLFECKQSLHPVSVFDLRTTFDYIKKAEKQLDNFNQEFANGCLIKELESKHKINLGEINKIVSCIVLSNRLFNGNAFKYPIRNISEIENIIERGTMRTNKGLFWLWKGNELCLNDLLDYFSLNSRLVKLFYDSLSVKTLRYELTNPAIEVEFYYLDSKKALPMLNDFTSTLRIATE
jgi:hypothetical protein